MKSKALITLAVAGTFACASAFAGGGTHSSVEIITPSSVSESAPWLTNQPHTAGWSSPASQRVIGFQESQFSDGPVGTSSSMSGGGSGGHDSSTSVRPDSSSSVSPDAAPMGNLDSANIDRMTVVEYWLLGAEPQGTGASSSVSGQGTVGFDSSSPAVSAGFDASTGSDPMSSLDFYGPDDLADAVIGEPLTVVYTQSAEAVADSIGEASPLMSEHYLVYGPLSSFTGHDLIVLEMGPEDGDLYHALAGDFYILTPSYDEG